MLLMKRLEDLHSELVHLKELRGSFDDDESEDEERDASEEEKETGADEAIAASKEESKDP